MRIHNTYIDHIEYVRKWNISHLVRPEENRQICKYVRHTMRIQESILFFHFDVSINLKRVIYINVMTCLTILTYINEPPDQSR